MNNTFNRVSRKRFVFLVASLLGAFFATPVFAQYDYYDPYSNSNIDYYPMNPVYTSPSNTTYTGTTDTSSGTVSSGSTAGSGTTNTTTTCANKPLANPQNTRSVEIRDKSGKVFYLSPPKEELVGMRAYPETSTKIFKIIYGTTGMQVDEQEVGLITVSNNCYPKYGYVKNETTVTLTATPSTTSVVTAAPAVESTVVPVDKTAVRLDPATGKVYHAKPGALIADARYDVALRKIFYKDTESTFGKVFTETTGYVNIDPIIKVTSPAPSIYQNNQTDVDFVKYPAPTLPVGDPDVDLPRTIPTPSSVGDLDRDGALDVVDKTAPSFSENLGNNKNWDFGGDDVRGWDPEKKKEVMAEKKEFAEMRSGQDLEHFAAGILLENDAIKEVALTGDVLEVASEEKGKFFWFIPVTFTSRVVVRLTPLDGGSAGATVSVRFPWWSAFVKKSYRPAALEKELNAEVSAVLDSSRWEKVDNSEAPTDASRIARALQMVSNIMKTKHDTVKNSISNVR